MKSTQIMKIAFVTCNKNEELSFRQSASKVKATVQFYFLKTLEELKPYLETGQIDIAILDFPDSNRLHYISKYFGKTPFVFLYGAEQKHRILKDSMLEYIEKTPFDKALRLLPFYINKLLFEKSQNFYQWTSFQVMQQGSALVVITDLEGNIEYVNSKFTDITGYTFDDVVGLNPSCLKSGTMDPNIYSMLWKNLLAGKEWRGDLLNKRKNGTLYWERALISPLRLPMGETYAYVKIAEDITTQKLADEKLRLSEQRYRSVIDNINIGIAIIDKKMQVLALNRKMQEWFPHADPESRPSCYRVLRGVNQDGVCAFCPAYKSFSDGKVHEVIIDAMINEKLVTYRILSCPIAGDNGDVLYVAELVEDVTEQRKAQIKLKEALEIQSEFTSMVSHELRTPLTAIKESINIVYDGVTGEINSDQKEFLGLAKTSVDRLARLINDILDFQKLEAGKVSFQMKPNDFVHTVKEVQGIMNPLFREKGLNFEVDLSNCPDTVVYDSDRIIQVLTNLISNAIKFTDEGSIRLSVEDKQDNITICVADSGIGVKEEDMPRLFKKFEQLSRGDGRQTGGTGLGLAICEQIIKQHNGSLWASSVYGKGTKFYFTLPKVADQRMWLLHRIDTYFKNIDVDIELTHSTLILFQIKASDGSSIYVEQLGEDGNSLSRLLSIVQNHLPRATEFVIEPKQCECIVFLPDYSQAAVFDLCAKIKNDFNHQEEPLDFPASRIKVDFSVSVADSTLNTGIKLYESAKKALSMPKRVVVIDDQQSILDNVVDSINDTGIFNAFGILGASEGLKFVKETNPDMVILDVNMPDMNGYEVLGHLKGNKTTSFIPVVLLTATASEAELNKKLIPGSVLVFEKTDQGLKKLVDYIKQELA